MLVNGSGTVSSLLNQKNASALPWKFVKGMGWLLVKAPFEFIVDVFRQIGKNIRGFSHAVWLMGNWRTPTTRAHIPDPTDPDLLSQLHSTRWTSDLSADKEAKRTYRLLRLQQYAWVIHLWLIPGLAAVWVYFHPTGPWTLDALTFSTLWRFIWILSVPNCLFCYLVRCRPFVKHNFSINDFYRASLLPIGLLVKQLWTANPLQ